MKSVAVIVREALVALCIFLVTTFVLYELLALGFPSGIPGRSSALSYGAWLAGAVRGDFGLSMVYNRTVAEIIGESLDVTLILVGGSLVFSVLIAVPLGILSAVRQDSVMMRSIMLVVVGASAMPVFLVSAMLLRFWFSHFAVLDLASASAWSRAARYIVPAMVLGLADGVTGEMAKQTEDAVGHVLREQYIRAIVARNGPVWLHAGRAFLPRLVSILTSRFAYVVGGALVVEYVFFGNGISAAALSALKYKDPTIVLAIGFLFSVFIVIGYFSNRITLVLSDPRMHIQHER